MLYCMHAIKGIYQRWQFIGVSFVTVDSRHVWSHRRLSTSCLFMVLGNTEILLVHIHLNTGVV